MVYNARMADGEKVLLGYGIPRPPQTKAKNKKSIQNRDVAQLVAREVWEREQTPPLQKIKSAKKPLFIRVFGTL